jgi:hypothetical protein
MKEETCRGCENYRWPDRVCVRQMEEQFRFPNASVERCDDYTPNDARRQTLALEAISDTFLCVLNSKMMNPSRR